MKKLFLSIVLALSIGSGIYATQVKSGEAIFHVKMWCSTSEHVRKVILRPAGAGLNYMLENCTLVPRLFPAATATISECIIINSKNSAVIVKVKIQGLEGFRYSWIGKDTLRKVLTEYATFLKCERNIQTGS